MAPLFDPARNAFSRIASSSRRDFLKSASLAVAAGALPATAALAEEASGANPSDSTSTSQPESPSQPESIVKLLYESLTPEQRKKICFAWDHTDKRGLLRTRVENNWQITEPEINGDFYSNDQRAMVREIFTRLIQPEWQPRLDKQLQDDAGGFGNQQSIAIFGEPGKGASEFVMTGRHMTLRCDGAAAEHLAFGGPIFYGHAASGFHEKPDHPGNVFWNQALAANQVYAMLDGQQRKTALVERAPRESNIRFRGSRPDSGLPVAAMTPDQREHVQKVLQKLIEPYRQSDRDRVTACLKAQGGLDECTLAFYREGDLGNDQVWDCWRLEGPAFVWHYRGAPHVHVWVNVADDPSQPTSAAG